MKQTPRYELCMRAENIVLPRDDSFGMSAATGGIAICFLFLIDASQQSFDYEPFLPEPRCR
ncbi:unnamed protein product [Cylicocyclus nassatus]|uniref:Uncharacterized protein n=1 Tax=Cylicocyclus nassatus TaxID=53992 RepID=A0AA36DQ00_CYLNA|nr:unnamed protein product [Cylicocyclus nassatus]